MYAQLEIGDDPTVWYFLQAGYDAVAAGLAQPGTPIVVDVICPLTGRLILNARAAGKVALTEPMPRVGWNPSGLPVPGLLLHVSSGTSPTKDDPGYLLAAGYDSAAVEQEIIAAMTGGTELTVALNPGPAGKGVLALSGATLAYAVLCPPAA